MPERIPSPTTARRSIGAEAREALRKSVEVRGVDGTSVLTGLIPQTILRSVRVKKPVTIATGTARRILAALGGRLA